MKAEKIEIIRSKRKTISIEIKRDLRVVVRAPRHMTDSEIQRFVLQKRDWIEKHLQQAEKRKNNNISYLENDEIEKLTDDAKEDIPPRVSKYASQLNVEFGRITIRHQKTRWGSCSSKKNLNFNCLLMLCPEDVRDYVVVHELCHLKEMNHSANFWILVEKVMPDYRAHRRWLKENGSKIIGRLK